MGSQILVGAITPLGPSLESAIDKRPIETPRLCTSLGLEGDQQADPKHHGGRERALHYYPQEHYAYWQEFWHALQLPESPTPFRPGAFGENITDLGWDESSVHIGDRFRLGEALLEISQPRSPCFKLNHRFGYPQMSLLVQTTGRVGWLMRVLEEGMVGPRDRVQRTHIADRRLSVRACLDALYNSPQNRDQLNRLAQHPDLSPGWRQHAEYRLRHGVPEYWNRRLYNRS